MAKEVAPGSGVQSQAQTGSAEEDYKLKNAPEKKADETGEPQFFDTTITKLVERENEDGKKEWVEVMSDNLYPGEKLKRVDDEEKAEKIKAKALKTAEASKAKSEDKYK